MNFLKAHKNYSAYVSGYKWVYPDGREDIMPAVKHPRSIFWSGLYIHLASFTFRKSVFEAGYVPNRFCDDTGAIFAIACAGKWEFSDKITFAYRQREGSIMHKSDKLELCVFELMLFQDCLNVGHMKWSSYSRYYSPLRYVWHNRRDLQNPKYEKYIESCNEYKNNVIGEVIKSDTNTLSRIHTLYMLVRGKSAKLFFKYAGKFYRLPNKIRKLYKKALPR